MTITPQGQFTVKGATRSFGERDLVACMLTKSVIGTDIVTVLFKNEGQSSQMLIRLAMIDLNKNSHRLYTQAEGDVSLDLNSDDSDKYMTHYSVVPSEARSSSECKTVYTVQDHVMKASFECAHLWSFRGNYVYLEDAVGSFECELLSEGK